MGWDGMGWDGMGWDGMGWDGMGWDGMVTRLFDMRKSYFLLRDPRIPANRMVFF
jgi:hypothetical protein